MPTPGSSYPLRPPHRTPEEQGPAPIGQIYPASGVLPEHMSDLTTFEGPDPVFWVPRGYAVVIADIPGTWFARGPASYISTEEAQNFYDLIEWAGVQDWSNGRVGLSGVSYLIVAQWQVAALSPPHLAAINPGEGWSDTYREVARHGGIPETSFWPYIWERRGASTGPIKNLERETREHPFYDEFWAPKAAALEAITVPAFVVAGWSDHGLHTRGTLEGFRRISSPQKWPAARSWGPPCSPATVPTSAAACRSRRSTPTWRSEPNTSAVGAATPEQDRPEQHSLRR